MLDSRLSTLHFSKIIDSKIIFGTTDYPVDKFFAMGRMAILVDVVKHYNYRYHYENCKHTRNAF